MYSEQGHRTNGMTLGILLPWALLVSQLLLYNSFTFSSARCRWRMYTTKRELDVYHGFSVFPFWSSESTLETQGCSQDRFWNKRIWVNVTTYKHVFLFETYRMEKEGAERFKTYNPWLSLNRSTHGRFRLYCLEKKKNWLTDYCNIFSLWCFFFYFKSHLEFLYINIKTWMRTFCFFP